LTRLACSRTLPGTDAHFVSPFSAFRLADSFGTARAARSVLANLYLLFIMFNRYLKESTLNYTLITLLNININKASILLEKDIN
jgi:hypothetical protein